MNIQGTEHSERLAQLLMSAGASRPGSPPQASNQGGPPSPIASIQNERGQGLMDIRGELQRAVKGALESFDGSGDLRSTIEGAIDSALASNGFDPDEVRGAMEDAGFGPMQAIRSGAGNPMAALFGGGAGAFDPSSLLRSGKTEEDLVQSFLQQFRAGVNLDLEG